ncbi:MAG: hypothetical protein JWM48_967 [Mycobacterium sp.]|jgi:uncharacterized protein YndB with AHSA1/START domain|nr:hypothetical protein [Mycobacterium sp.]MCW2744417.1 hypothetical protein [Mycobacterium sp.]
MARFTVTRQIAAPPETVWHLLSDITTWRDWTPFTSSERTKEGAGYPDGVGSLRRLTTPVLTTVEEIVVSEPPHRLVYEMRSGLPLRNYRGEVLVEPYNDDSTCLTYTVSFGARVPGAAAALAPGAKLALEHLVARLAKAAARAAKAPATA